MFPNEVAENKTFVVLEPYEQGMGADTAVTVPSLRRGDYLYFRCMRSDLYAVGIVE